MCVIAHAERVGVTRVGGIVFRVDWLAVAALQGWRGVRTLDDHDHRPQASAEASGSGHMGWS